MQWSDDMDEYSECLTELRYTLLRLGLVILAGVAICAVLIALAWTQ